MRSKGSSSSESSPRSDESPRTVVSESVEKLKAVATLLQPWVTTCHEVPIGEECDTKGYRCKCSFQVVSLSETAQDNKKVVSQLSFAIRKDQQPVVIHDFPVANRRIQIAMKQLLAVLNSDQVPHLRHDLASVSFSSSWNGDCFLAKNSSSTDGCCCDCLVTLNYHAAVPTTEEWQRQARAVCQDLELTQLTGRSKKQVLRAMPQQPTIRDTIWLLHHETNESATDEWTVQLTERALPETVGKTIAMIPVLYQKPEGAFCHPNPRVMCLALSWMLIRVSRIRRELGRKVRLLELYCGCGAHTVALAKSGLLECIDAVEMDERLVRSCQINCAMNQCLESLTTRVNIYSSDAGQFATIYAKQNMSGAASTDYDVLLVDPPRQGLDEDVCRMAQQGSFQYVLYISCGRDALVRDLDRLSQHFVVQDCTLLDLFPGTRSVESLVYLRRRM